MNIRGLRPTWRIRPTPLAVSVGLVAAVGMALTLSGTLSAFSASITNSSNTVTTGSLLMREDGPSGATCSSSPAGTVSTANTASCSTINKFGTSQYTAGTVQTTNITITNSGTLDAKTFTLMPAATCSQAKSGSNSGAATDLCSKVSVVIKTGSTQIFSGTALSLGTATAASFTNFPSAVAAGSSVPFTFVVTLDSAASNDYQGLTATVPLTWNFTG